MISRILTKNSLFTLLVLLFVYVPVKAQDTITVKPLDNIIRLEKDSVYPFENNWTMLDSTFFVYVDTLTINPMFMPVVFDGKVLPDEYELGKPYQLYATPSYIPEQKPVDLFADKLFQKKLRRKAYLYLTANHPTAIKYAANLLPTDIPQAKEIKVNPFTQIFNVEKDVNFSSSEKLEMRLPKRRYWTAGFETSIQFSQNHISENWHKGGTSNFNLLSINKFRHEYEKDRVKISNSVEYKLSIYTAPNDTLRKYRIGDDAFSIISSYGYKAFSNWFYSLSVDARTQFFKNYYENKTTKSSAFLSPLTVNVGVGMEYKLSKKFSQRYRTLELSTNLSPFSYNMKYIKDDDVDHKRHGLDPDQHFLKSLGSKWITTFQFNLNRNVSWNSKLYYFTNYERVEAEMENTLNLALSRYFSTRIFFHVRFDDNVKKKEPTDSYFQYYEILSFGFNYKF